MTNVKHQSSICNKKFYLHNNDFLPDYEQNEMNFIDMSRDEHDSLSSYYKQVCICKTATTI